MGWFSKKMRIHGISNKRLRIAYHANRIMQVIGSGNLRRGFKRITLVMVVIGSILGLLYGVATVLDEHDYENIGLRSEQKDYKDGYKSYKVLLMLMQILRKETSPSEDELNELWKVWTGEEMPTEKGAFYTEEEFLKKMQERKEKKLEDGLRVNFDPTTLLIVCVLVGLVGAAVVYFGIWVVVWVGGIAIYNFIRWLFFGFYDAIAGVNFLFRKGTQVLNKYRPALLLRGNNTKTARTYNKKRAKWFVIFPIVIILTSLILVAVLSSPRGTRAGTEYATSTEPTYEQQWELFTPSGRVLNHQVNIDDGNQIYDDPIYEPLRIGQVTGLFYSDDPSVIIDRQILKAGDTIHGVKVVKILKDKVELEKNGKKWTQKVGAEPGPEWQ